MIINTLVNKVNSAAMKIQLWWLKCKYKGKDPYDRGEDDKDKKDDSDKGSDDPPDDSDDEVSLLFLN